MNTSTTAAALEVWYSATDVFRNKLSAYLEPAISRIFSLFESHVKDSAKNIFPSSQKVIHSSIYTNFLRNIFSHFKEGNLFGWLGLSEILLKVYYFRFLQKLNFTMFVLPSTTSHFFFSWLDSPSGPRPPHHGRFDITLRRATLGRTLNEWHHFPLLHIISVHAFFML
jgi:hypothetical protein